MMKKRTVFGFVVLVSVLFLLAGCAAPDKTLPDEDLAAEEELESLLDEDGILALLHLRRTDNVNGEERAAFARRGFEG